MIDSWQLPGAEGRPIIGTVHRPSGTPRGVVLIAHGFKGYKDYGMFPVVAAACEGAGFYAYRFNFSHSGMTERTETFERADLFELDTWNRQVDDLRTVARAAHDGPLDGGGLPQIWFGHSRGGVTVLLTAGRDAGDAEAVEPAGIVTAAAPATCCSLDDAQRRTLLEQGFIESPSSRTGQTLRVGRGFLQEQLDDPSGHDLTSLVSRIRCPLLIVHGEDDPTVPASAAATIANAAAAPTRTVLIPGADHVFDTPNPFPPDAEPSTALTTLLNEVVGFIKGLEA